MENDPDIEIDFRLIIDRANREHSILNLWHSFFNSGLQICNKITDSLNEFTDELNSSSLNTSNAQIALQHATIELKEMQTAIKDMGESVNRKVVSPMEKFLKHYKNRITTVENEGNLVIEFINKMHKGADNLKNNYWKQHESFTNSLKEESTSIDTIHVLDKSLTETKKQYAEFIPYANKNIYSKHLTYKSTISSLYEIEVSKIELLKDLLKEQVNVFKSLGKILLDKAISLSSILSFFNVKTEIEMINVECSAKNFFFAPLPFLDFNVNDSSKQLIYDNYFISTDNMSNESISMVFKKTIDNLKEGKDMTLDEKAYIVEFLHHAHTRKLFANILEDIKEPICISSESSFKSLSDLINYMLSRFVLENDDDYSILSSVLNAAKNVFLKVLV